MRPFIKTAKGREIAEEYERVKKVAFFRSGNPSGGRNQLLLENAIQDTNSCAADQGGNARRGDGIGKERARLRQKKMIHVRKSRKDMPPRKKQQCGQGQGPQKPQKKAPIRGKALEEENRTRLLGESETSQRIGRSGAVK